MSNIALVKSIQDAKSTKFFINSLRAGKGDIGFINSIN